MPQDFSHQNLRGRSFKGQNLAWANFSYSDIRGADFTGAELTSANFSHAQAGLQHRWIVGLLVTSCLLLAISGIFSGYSAYFITLILDHKNSENFSAGLTSLIVVTIFFSTVIRKGLLLGLGTGLASGITIGAIIGVTTRTGFGAVIGVGVITASVTAIGAFAKAFAVALAMSVAEFIGGFIAVIVAIAASFIAATTVAQAGSFIINENIPGYVAGAIAVFSSYIGWSAFKKSQEDSWISSFAITFATTRGTSFRNANLTKAKFCQALLKSTDLRSSILIDTCWHKARKINDIRPGITYLKYEQLREVLVTGQGQEKIFDRQDLRGVNLKGANLIDASFIGTDLSHANLQDADLSRAKLVQTQLDGTDFTGATLTGAYIEDWNITTDTNFDGVRCECVYMRLPTPDNPDPHRKPDNRQEVFGDGEFGDFIKPIFDTLDLYHSQGVDPRAIAISFKQLAENHPEADLRFRVFGFCGAFSCWCNLLHCFGEVGGSGEGFFFGCDRYDFV
ncbi:pentapeptide repeat-containing protein [Nostoc sp. NMS4]|uniref:pentapeptide repeat-containing protein n=1 Tax=Nostoc sp. NMS4 TaxID=2815390 RepID=UPI0025FECE09|nr:pentapeptide repeat-containing protein [Nostoc sp. NMS4]MBN3925233.1 pentapeptide repeat-containing protein [Nostoc sp. NMS4]